MYRFPVVDRLAPVATLLFVGDSAPPASLRHRPPPHTYSTLPPVLQEAGTPPVYGTANVNLFEDESDGSEPPVSRTATNRPTPSAGLLTPTRASSLRPTPSRASSLRPTPSRASTARPTTTPRRSDGVTVGADGETRTPQGFAVRLFYLPTGASTIAEQLG